MQEHLKTLLASGDVQAILELFASLEARADAALEEADALGEALRKANHRNKYLTRLVYGRRSEKLTEEELKQLSLAFDSEDGKMPVPENPDLRDEEASEGEGDSDAEPRDDTKPPKPKRRRPNHPGRTPLSPDLERIIKGKSLVPEDKRACMYCGDLMCFIRWEEHEKVVHVPAHFVVHVEQREVIACKAKDCSGEAVTAERLCASPLPLRVDASVLADLIESKCDDSMPVYRIRDRYARLGFDIPMSTLHRYWTVGTDMLIPLADVILGVVLDEDIVCIDCIVDTGIPVLREVKDKAAAEKKKRKGKGKKKERFRGHLWAFKGNISKMVAFQFTETWEATQVQPWLEAISGYMQVDDYKGYSSKLPSFSDANKVVVLVPDERRLGCMMHVRRRFYDAFTLGDTRAGPAVEWIRKIYKVEDEAKKNNLDAQGRHALRQEKSVSVLAEFYEWVNDMSPKLGKTSKLAQAVRYAQNQRLYVERCFTDGRFEIDNGAIERELKKPCVGRRNYLHCGSINGAKRLAAAYTVVLSAKARDLDVAEYLSDVLDRLARGVDVAEIRSLVPDAWAAARAAAADPAGE